MTWLVRGIVAAATLVAASVMTKELTGKHIHEHLYAWWTKLRDDLLAWAHDNGHLAIVSWVVWMDNRVSGVARLVFRARTDQGTVTVCEEELSLEEALEMFPELRQSQEADITAMVTA